MLIGKKEIIIFEEAVHKHDKLAHTGGLPTRRYGIFLSNEIFPKINNRNLFTASVFGLKKL